MAVLVGCESAPLEFFARRRPGPEIEIEDAVTNSLGLLFPTAGEPSCILGSMKIGSGAPDLTLVHCLRNVTALAEVDKTGPTVLAYLRVVHRARFDTLVDRLKIRPTMLAKCLDSLAQADILRVNSQVFSLEPIWRHILPEVIAVEAKVSKWRDAITQASRNCVFAHRSYVALPERQARLAASYLRAGNVRIGVISIPENQHPKIIRRSPRTPPRVWRYYYEIAAESARLLKAA